MLSHYRNLVRKCRPIVICQHDADAGPRIGGKAPEGITPPMMNPWSRYFVTVPLDEENELSIFISMDYDDASPSSLWENAVRLHSSDCKLVQCVVHHPARRSRSSLLTSELSGHALRIADECPDIVVEPRGALLIPSKIGGTPYFYYDNQAYMASVRGLFEESFIYLLQFTCPTAREAPK